MSLNDLKTITMRREETANFIIRLMMLEGVGYEVMHQRKGGYDRALWKRRLLTNPVTLAEAEAAYDDQLRLICIAEAKLALGLLEP